MSLDHACLLIVLSSAVAGALLGALSQLAMLGAVAAGWLGARWVAPMLAPFVHGHVPAFAAGPVASVAAFVLCTTAGTVLLKTLARMLSPREGAAAGANRGVGALLGGLHAAVVLWVLLSALAAWGRPIQLGPVRLDPRGSDLTAVAREHSAFTAWRSAGDRAER